VAASFLDDDAIEKLPLIHVSGYYHEWRWWQEQFDPESLDPLLEGVLTNHKRTRGKQDFVVDNSLIAYQLASQGLGLAMGRTSLVAGMIKAQQLRQFSSANSVEAPEGFYLSMSELGEQQPVAQLLFDFLTAETV